MLLFFNISSGASVPWTPFISLSLLEFLPNTHTVSEVRFLPCPVHGTVVHLPYDKWRLRGETLFIGLHAKQHYVVSAILYGDTAWAGLPGTEDDTPFLSLKCGLVLTGVSGQWRCFNSDRGNDDDVRPGPRPSCISVPTLGTGGSPWGLIYIMRQTFYH